MSNFEEDHLSAAWFSFTLSQMFSSLVSFWMTSSLTSFQTCCCCCCCYVPLLQCLCELWPYSWKPSLVHLMLCWYSSAWLFPSADIFQALLGCGNSPSHDQLNHLLPEKNARLPVVSVGLVSLGLTNNMATILKPYWCGVPSLYLWSLLPYCYSLTTTGSNKQQVPIASSFGGIIY